MTVGLVAMARLGEVFISRDDRGRFRRHSRYLPGEPTEIDEAEAEWAISQYDYARIGEAFDSWHDLAARVEELVPKTSVSASGLQITPEIAIFMLPRIRSGAASDDLGERADAQRVLLRLMSDEQIVTDGNLQATLSRPTQVESDAPASGNDEGLR